MACTAHLKIKTRLISGILVIITAAVLSGAKPVSAQSNKIPLFPKVHAGDTLTYLIRFNSKKIIKTESRVVTPNGPDDSEISARRFIQLQIIDVRPEGIRSTIRARTQFLKSDAAHDTGSGPHSEPPSMAPLLDAKRVEFTLQANGQVDDVIGVADLFPEEQQAWQEWIRQFAIAATVPAEGMKLGQSRKFSQPEEAPSPIAKLEWDKQLIYVRDEACPAQTVASEKEITTPPDSTIKSTNSHDRSITAPPQMCAVLLLHAILKQKSPPKDTTPPDFRARELRTFGTARGTNETICYVSQQTGLVLRTTEQAQQFMDVVIARSDNANQVHYNINAQSRSEIALVNFAAAWSER